MPVAFGYFYLFVFFLLTPSVQSKDSFSDCKGVNGIGCTRLDEDDPFELFIIKDEDVYCGGIAGDRLIGDKRGGLRPLLPLLPLPIPKLSNLLVPYLRVELLNLSIMYRMGATTPTNMTKRPRT